MVGRRGKRPSSSNVLATATRTTAPPEPPSSDSWDISKVSLQLDAKKLCDNPNQGDSEKIAQEIAPKKQSSAKVAKSKSAFDFSQSDNANKKLKCKEADRKLGPII